MVSVVAIWSWGSDFKLRSIFCSTIVWNFAAQRCWMIVKMWTTTCEDTWKLWWRSSLSRVSKQLLWIAIITSLGEFNLPRIWKVMVWSIWIPYRRSCEETRSIDLEVDGAVSYGICCIWGIGLRHCAWCLEEPTYGICLFFQSQGVEHSTEAPKLEKGRLMS